MRDNYGMNSLAVSPVCRPSPVPKGSRDQVASSCDCELTESASQGISKFDVPRQDSRHSDLDSSNSRD